MRILFTGTSNRGASSSLNASELKFSSKGKTKVATTACMPTGIGSGVGAVGDGVGAVGDGVGAIGVGVGALDDGVG